VIDERLLPPPPLSRAVALHRRDAEYPCRDLRIAAKVAGVLPYHVHHVVQQFLDQVRVWQLAMQVSCERGAQRVIQAAKSRSIVLGDLGQQSAQLRVTRNAIGWSGNDFCRVQHRVEPLRHMSLQELSAPIGPVGSKP